MFPLFTEYSVRKATTFKSQKKREKQKRPSDPCRTWETGANFPAIRYLYTRRRAPFFLVVVGGGGGRPKKKEENRTLSGLDLISLPSAELYVRITKRSLEYIHKMTP